MKIGEQLASFAHTRSFCFSAFIKSLSAVLLMDSESMLKADAPDFFVAGKNRTVKTTEAPSVHDCLFVLNGNDTFRSECQTAKLIGFLNWFADRDAPEDDEYPWYGVPYVAWSWNEYILNRRQRMTLEELKAEAEKHGYKLVRKDSYVPLDACPICGEIPMEWLNAQTRMIGFMCGCKRKINWASSEHWARIAWNKSLIGLENPEG